MKTTRGYFFILTACLALWIGMPSCKPFSLAVTPSPIPPTRIIPSETALPPSSVPATNTPAPTNTSRPNPARIFVNSVLSMIADRPPDVQDDFSNPASGWEVGRQNDDMFIGTRNYVDGHYVMIADAANAEQMRRYGYGFVSSANNRLGDGLTDYVFEVEQSWVHGEGWTMINLLDADGYAYSVRLSRPGQYGGFWLESPKRGPETAVEFTNNILFPSDAFEKKLVRITFIIQGEQFAILADGKPVYYSTHSGERKLTLSGVEFHLLTKSDMYSIEIHWDNLKIWDLNR